MLLSSTCLDPEDKQAGLGAGESADTSQFSLTHFSYSGGMCVGRVFSRFPAPACVKLDSTFSGSLGKQHQCDIIDALFHRLFVHHSSYAL